MHIEISIPRPLLTLSVIAGVVWVIADGIRDATPAVTASATEIVQSEPVSVDTHAATVEETPIKQSPSRLRAAVVPQGGVERVPAEVISEAEDDVRRARQTQALLERKEELLRFELKQLEEERRALGPNIDPETEEQFRDATRTLTALLQDEKTAERFLLASLNQIWDAQGRATSLGHALDPSDEEVTFLWPVDVSRGITAPFHDPSYKQFFGFDHKGTDIRAAQGTTVRAAGDGIVKDVSDNGLGFNSVTIEHANGMVTLYGHVSAFLVSEGDTVQAGDPIALSGGMPGLSGSGPYTTGPHLHLELYVNGVAVNAEEYLPLQ